MDISLECNVFNLAHNKYNFLTNITFYDTFAVAIQFGDRSMNLDVAKPGAKTGSKAPLRATGPGSGPPKFKQRNSRHFKSKPPKRGVIG